MTQRGWFKEHSLSVFRKRTTCPCLRFYTKACRFARWRGLLRSARGSLTLGYTTTSLARWVRRTKASWNPRHLIESAKSCAGMVTMNGWLNRNRVMCHSVGEDRGGVDMEPLASNLFLRLHKWASRQDENFL